MLVAKVYQITECFQFLFLCKVRAGFIKIIIQIGCVIALFLLRQVEGMAQPMISFTSVPLAQVLSSMSYREIKKRFITNSGSFAGRPRVLLYLFAKSSLVKINLQICRSFRQSRKFLVRIYRWLEILKELSILNKPA